MTPLAAAQDAVSQAPSVFEVVGVLIVIAAILVAFVVDQTGPGGAISRTRFVICIALLSGAIALSGVEIVLASITDA